MTALDQHSKLRFTARRGVPLNCNWTTNDMTVSDKKAWKIKSQQTNIFFKPAVFIYKPTFRLQWQVVLSAVAVAEVTKLTSTKLALLKRYELAVRLKIMHLHPKICRKNFVTICIFWVYWLTSGIQMRLPKPSAIHKLPFCILNFCIVQRDGLLSAGVGNLGPAVQMRPAWTFDTARIRIFVAQVRVQHRLKTKLHDKQVLNSKSREATRPHSYIKVEF